MKKLLLTAAAVLASLSMYAQGQGTNIVNFSIPTTAPDTARVWVNDTGRVGDGTRANGSYSVALFYAPAGTRDEGAFTQVGSSATFFGSATTSGTFSGGFRSIIGSSPTYVNGGVVALQVRAWETVDGTTFAAAEGNPLGNVGKSVILDVDSNQPGELFPPPPVIGSYAGWSGFSITPVPEPSVIGLGLLGVGALLMLRRRK